MRCEVSSRNTMVFLYFCLVTASILATNVNQIEASDLHGLIETNKIPSIWEVYTPVFKIIKLIVNIVDELKIKNQAYVTNMKEISDSLKKYFLDPPQIRFPAVPQDNAILNEIKEEAKETVNQITYNLENILNGPLRSNPFEESLYSGFDELPNLDNPKCRSLYSNLIKSVKNVYKDLSENTDCTLPQSFLEKYYLSPAKIAEPLNTIPVSFSNGKNNEYPYDPKYPSLRPMSNDNNGQYTPLYESKILQTPNYINDPLDESKSSYPNLYNDPTSLQQSPFTYNMGNNYEYNNSQDQFNDPIVGPVNSLPYDTEDKRRNSLQNPVDEYGNQLTKFSGKSGFGNDFRGYVNNANVDDLASDLKALNMIYSDMNAAELPPKFSLPLGQNILLNNLPEQTYHSPSNPYFQGNVPQNSIPNPLWTKSYNPNIPNLPTAYNHVQLNAQDFSNQLNYAQGKKQMHNANIKYMGTDYSPYAKQLNMQTVTNMKTVTDLDKLKQNILQDNKKYSLLAFVFAAQKPIIYWPLYYTVLKFPTAELLSQIDLLNAQGYKHTVASVLKLLSANRQASQIPSDYPIPEPSYVKKYETNMPVVALTPLNSRLTSNIPSNDINNVLVPEQKTLKKTTYKYMAPISAYNNKETNIYDILKPANQGYQEQSAIFGYPVGLRSANNVTSTIT